MADNIDNLINEIKGITLAHQGIKQRKEAIFDFLMKCDVSTAPNEIYNIVGFADTYDQAEMMTILLNDLKNMRVSLGQLVGVLRDIHRSGYSKVSLTDTKKFEGDVMKIYLYLRRIDSVKVEGNKPSVNRLLDLMPLYLRDCSLEGFLFNKRYSRYKWASFGIHFIGDNKIFAEVLGSVVRLHFDNENNKVSLRGVALSITRQRRAHPKNLVTIIEDKGKFVVTNDYSTTLYDFLITQNDSWEVIQKSFGDYWENFIKGFNYKSEVYDVVGELDLMEATIKERAK